MSATATKILENVRALEPRIRQSAETIEADRRLPADLARDLMEAQVFRMGTSHAYGGPELDPMSQVRVVEELARIEGSASRLPPLAAERPIGRCRRDKWGVLRSLSDWPSGTLTSVVFQHSRCTSLAVRDAI